MTRRRRVQDANASTPALQDEADIVEEVGAEFDESTGELVASEESVRKIGAVDAESVIENRRTQAAIDKKSGGVSGVSFNAGDILSKYEFTIKSWPPNTLHIYVKRLTGAPVEHTIMSHPKSGAELYEAIKGVHGQYEEAKYAVKFLDSNGREFRGQGHITMPDTRTPQQQGQPVNYPQQQPAPQPPQVVPAASSPAEMMAVMKQMLSMVQQLQTSAQPQQPPQQPQYVPAPTSSSTTEMLPVLQQMLQMVQQLQTSVQQPQQPQYVPVTAPLPSSTPSSPAEMMQVLQQMLQMVQQLQPTPVAPARGQPPQSPQVTWTPPPSPQAGLAESMSLMEQMFKMFQRMQGQTAPPGPGPGGPYRGPRPPYYPQGESDRGGAPSYPGPHAPPPRQPTPVEQFRESMSFIRTAVDAVQEMNSLMPQQGAPAYEAAEEDDSPVRVFEAGPAKIVVDKKDGTLRGWETGWANMGGVLKWVGEQREAIQKANIERQQQQQARQQPTQQLPPGYVEVGAGYQPPPGYVAIPVDSAGNPLPPPPEHVPPPIQSSPSAGRRTWGAPTIPEGES